MDAERHALPKATTAAEQVAGTSRTAEISPAERDMLAFAISWLPYGGGPADEVWVNFGMTRDRYVQRLCELIERHRAQIHPATAKRLIRTECERSRRADAAASR